MHTQVSSGVSPVMLSPTQMLMSSANLLSQINAASRQGKHSKQGNERMLSILQDNKPLLESAMAEAKSKSVGFFIQSAFPHLWQERTVFRDPVARSFGLSLVEIDRDAIREELITLVGDHERAWVANTLAVLKDWDLTEDHEFITKTSSAKYSPRPTLLPVAAPIAESPELMEANDEMQRRLKEIRVGLSQLYQATKSQVEHSSSHPVALYLHSYEDWAIHAKQQDLLCHIPTMFYKNMRSQLEGSTAEGHSPVPWTRGMDANPYAHSSMFLTSFQSWMSGS